MSLKPDQNEVFDTIYRAVHQRAVLSEEDGVVLPEMTYNYCPTGVPKHLLQLKKVVPVMIIRDVLYPHLANGKLFIVRGYSRRCFFLSQIDDDGIVISNHALHRIDFQFTFCRCESYKNISFRFGWRFVLQFISLKDKL